jgi:hypothetical protein
MFRRIAVVAGLLAIAGRSAAAQTCTINSTAAGTLTCTVGTTVSLTIPTLLKLTMSNFSSGTTTTLTAPTLTDFDDVTGLASVTTAGPNFVVKANRSYTVYIKADAATFTHTVVNAGDPVYNKPISDVQWTKDGSTFNTLTTSNVSVATGAATAASASVPVSYKLAYNIVNDKPGGYTLGVTYTLSAP